MEEELQRHLKKSAALYERRGLPPDEARWAARRALGNATAIAEGAREARGTRVLDDFRRRLRTRTLHPSTLDAIKC